MFGIFDIDTYNIGTSQGLRCSGHLRCSNFARKSNFAKLAMFDFKRTIAKKAELRKIPRPSQSSNLRKGVFAPSGMPKPLPLGEVSPKVTERASPLMQKIPRAAELHGGFVLWISSGDARCRASRGRRARGRGSGPQRWRCWWPSGCCGHRTGAAGSSHSARWALR